ncbi:hypothetical protein L1F28_09445 [Arthrospira platensis NCB002]|uniref:hypothetical protein n=1 Tax=Limnospira platensis TaxID=118562 RepID=UPI0013053CB4|nr:hypothetical protein [Arthrospira platensis]MDF2208970.1 hypothetical protein [Arthrospira platensis NCB002]
MVNYSQSWRSRSVPARSIAYILGSATYRLLSGKCVRAACPPEVSPRLWEVRPIA